MKIQISEPDLSKEQMEARESILPSDNILAESVLYVFLR
jgi:hypothetical protein